MFGSSVECGQPWMVQRREEEGVWKNHLYEADGFEVEHMMGEIESVQVSE